MFRTANTLVPHIRCTPVPARVRSPTNDRRLRRHERCWRRAQVPCGCGEDCGGGEGDEGIGIPAGVCARVCASEASDIARASVIVRVVVDPLVVSSDRTDCDRIEGDGSVSSSCCCCGREP